ncbi:MAG: kynureninase, partial [Rhodobacteraceae bacterium]|nr:kynureninase [Paracoccaceae bacterium]
MTDALDRLTRRAAEEDAQDPLADRRALFHIPEGMIYLDGNSLGLMPRAVAQRVKAAATGDWAEGLIRSWTDAGWFHLPMRVGDRIAPLVGAGTGEIAVGDSTSVNLFKCLAAALQLRPGRTEIVAEGGNFPTDSYIAQGLTALVPGASLRYVAPGDDPGAACGPQTAVLLLSHVDYRSAAIRDMTAITAAAQAAGALALWDLSHTTGAIACDLHAAGADMAVGCTYKYL